MPYRSCAISAAVLFATLIFARGDVEAQSQVFDFEQGVSGYTGFDDTTIFSESDNSGGGTAGVFSGTILNLDFGGNMQHRRALIRADVSVIPANWIVEDVTLTMTVQTSGGNFGDIDYSLHRVTDSWGEGTVVGASAGGFGGPVQNGDATWLSGQHNVALWATPGGDFVGGASATAAAGTSGAVVVWNSAGLVNDVQQWVASPGSNDGWIIIGALEGTQQRVKKFYSSESASLRPHLQITASPPPPAVPAANGIVLLMQILAVSFVCGACYFRRFL